MMSKIKRGTADRYNQTRTSAELFGTGGACRRQTERSGCCASCSADRDARGE